ncbi:MAG: GGDEF domain-containing protein [Alphaproteobacteria bacterium]
MSIIRPTKDFSEASQVEEISAKITTVDHINDYLADGHIQRIGIPQKLRNEFSEILDREAGQTPASIIKLVKGLMITLQGKHRQLERAGYDPLTGALNLNGLAKELERSQRYPARQYATIFIDLDGFKELNDNCGHKAGDEALIEVINRLSNEFFERDLVVRKGGDEIVLILPFNGDDKFDESLVVKKVRACLAGLHKMSRNDVPFPIGASIGVDVFDVADMPSNILLPDTVSESITRADDAMYENKWGPNMCFKTDDGKDPRAPKNIRLAKLRAMLGELMTFDKPEPHA